MYEPRPEDLDKIERDFTYKTPFGNQPARYVSIRDVARAFALVAVSLCPASRELSIGLNKLSEAVMWFNASIARNEVNPDA